MSLTDGDSSGHPALCRFHMLHQSGCVSVGVHECSGAPLRSPDESTTQAEIVLPQRGAYLRRDHAGSVYLDESVVGFFEPGRSYSIEHLEARPDRTTVIRLPRRADSECGAAGFPRAAVRASARLLVEHDALLRLLRDDRADPLAKGEMAASFASRVIEFAGDGPDLGHGALPRRAFTDDVVVAVAEFIRGNLRRRLTLDEIAAYAGYSPFHLCRAFRERMKLTLFQYLLHLRLRAAHEALLETTEPIGAIALDHGFCSNAHFTAHYRRWAGSPPSSARRNRAPASPASMPQHPAIR